MKAAMLYPLGALLSVNLATAQAAEVRPLTESCEIALALSGAPDHLQQEAGVFVLKQAGFERVKESQNGFNCIVERNHSESIIPICFGPASTGANLVAILDGGKQIRNGASFADMLQHRQEAVAAGAYARPGPGISYMVSDFTYIFNPSLDAMLDVSPHIMFNAPGLSAAEIGANDSAMLENRGLPMINDPGSHGFMVSFIEKPSDTDAVEQACQGQLPDPAGMRKFP